MPDMELYAVPIPEGAQSQAGANVATQQALQAILGSDTGSVESIATEPGEETITVEYPDVYARVRAKELRELASGLSQPLPYHAQEGTSLEDRYVSISNADVEPVDPRSGKFVRARLTLSDEGTPATHWHRLRAVPSQVDHPWGNELVAPVGVPAVASRVRWYNPDTGETAEPAVQATRSAKGGDVNILDVTASPFYSSAGDTVEVIYGMSLGQIGFTDPRVWDTRGFDSMEDADGNTQFQKVFSGSHAPEGKLFAENGVVRLGFNPPTNALTAERWDDANSTWTSQSLGNSSWELFDVDLRQIGLAQVGAVVEFRDPTASPTAYHTLSLQLARGYQDPLWATQSAVPSGLVDLLDPIAAMHVYNAFGAVEEGAPHGLRERAGVK